MLHGMRQLTSHHARYDIAHAVVVAELLMLVPRGVLAALRRPFARFVCPFFVIGQQHTAAASGDDLVAVPRQHAHIAEGTCLFSFICSAKRLGGVFDYQSVVLVGYRLYLIYFAGSAVQMSDDDQPYLGVKLKRFFERGRVHVPCIVFGIDEYRLAALIRYRVYGSVKGHIRGKYLFALERAVARLRLTVELLRAQLDA